MKWSLIRVARQHRIAQHLVCVSKKNSHMQIPCSSQGSARPLQSYLEAGTVYFVTSFK